MPYIKTTATNRILAIKKRVRIIQGGTSSSKTISILLYLIALAQSDKVPTLTSIVSESLPHLRRGAIKDFLDIMRTHNYFKDSLWSKSEFTYTFETGSRIEFFSADQPDRLRGARRDRLFINECNNVSLDCFEQLEVRTKEFVFLDFNPSSEFWVFTEVMPKRNDWDKIILTYKDNEGLSREIIESIEQRKNRAGWWKVYGLGELGEVEGRIYTGWGIIDTIPETARLLRVGVDFGFSVDPTSIVGTYRHDGALIFDEAVYKKGMSNRQIADILNSQFPHALVVADSAEPKSIEEIRSYGVNIIPASKGPGSVSQGIQQVQDAKCFITKRSVNGIREYRNYLWAVDRDGTQLKVPESGNDHFLDAMRYSVAGFRDSTDGVGGDAMDTYMKALQDYSRPPQKVDAVFEVTDYEGY